MCFNAEISLNTFIYGCISAVILILLNQTLYSNILIVFSFTLMQLLEYFVWKNINNKKNIKILSIIAIFLIIFQLFLLNYFTNKKYRYILLSILFFFIIIYFIFIFPNTNFDMKKGKNGHLIWYWSDISFYWYIIVFLLYLIPLYLSKRFFAFIYCLLSIIISLYFYYKYKTFGTIWCYLSNILWIFLILYAIYKNVKKTFI